MCLTLQGRAISWRWLDVYVDWGVDTPGKETSSTWEIYAISTSWQWHWRGGWGWQVQEVRVCVCVWESVSEGRVWVEKKRCIYAHAAHVLCRNLVGSLSSKNVFSGQSSYILSPTLGAWSSFFLFFYICFCGIRFYLSGVNLSLHWDWSQ